MEGITPKEPAKNDVMEILKLVIATSGRNVVCSRPIGSVGDEIASICKAASNEIEELRKSSDFLLNTLKRVVRAKRTDEDYLKCLNEADRLICKIIFEETKQYLTEDKLADTQCTKD